MLTKVIGIQRREGLSDGRMAVLLGIARPTWNRIRNGHAEFGDALAVKAAGVWPELTRELLDLAAQSSVSAVTEQGNARSRRVAPVLRDETRETQ